MLILLAALMDSYMPKNSFEGLASWSGMGAANMCNAMCGHKCTTGMLQKTIISMEAGELEIGLGLWVIVHTCTELICSIWFESDTFHDFHDVIARFCFRA